MSTQDGVGLAQSRVHVVADALYDIIWNIRSRDYDGNFDTDLEEIARIAIEASDSTYPPPQPPSSTETAEEER